MNIEEKKQLINMYCDNIFNNRNIIEQTHMKLLFNSEITLNEVHLLEVLSENVFQSMSELANKVHVTPGTLTTSIKKLIKKGYARRVQDGEDKRVFTIELTPEGFETVEQHKKLHDKLILAIWREDSIDNDKLLEVLAGLHNYFEKVVRDLKEK